MRNIEMKETDTAYTLTISKNSFEEEDVLGVLKMLRAKELAKKSGADFSDMDEEIKASRKRLMATKLPDILSRIETYKKENNIVE